MKTVFASLAIVFLALSGCTKGGSPQFLSPPSVSPSENPRVGDPRVGAPWAVDEELAKQSGIIHLIYHVGPVDLPSGTKLETGQTSPIVMRFEVDEPLWLLGFEPKLIDDAGEEIPSQLLYKAVISNMHEENPLCQEGGNPFFITTSCLTSINLPDGYGYPVLPGDSLEAQVTFYNPTDRNFSNVSFELNVTAKSMNEFSALKAVKPMLLDLEPCSHKSIAVEPQQFVRRTASFAMPDGGNLLLANAMLGDYSSYAALFKKSETQPFWRADSELDGDHRVLNILNNPFEDPNGIQFKKGDGISLEVAYDNAGSSWLAGAVASAMIYFAPE